MNPNTALKRVLIVEDELLIAYSIKEMLISSYEVVDVVISFEDAMDVLENEVLDLVLLDVTLAGDKTGMDLATVLNKAGVPFIFLTALTHSDALSQLISYNPAAYLSKPISKPDLITAMELAMVKNQKPPTHLEVAVGKVDYKFELDKLIYIEADHIYCHIILVDEKALIRIPLKKLVDQSHNILKRINRKIAINPKYIRSQTNSSITLTNDKTFSISKKYI